MAQVGRCSLLPENVNTGVFCMNIPVSKLLLRHFIGESFFPRMHLFLPFNFNFHFHICFSCFLFRVFLFFSSPK
jgi:hypothetical protein